MAPVGIDLNPDVGIDLNPDVGIDLNPDGGKLAVVSPFYSLAQSMVLCI